MSRNLIQRLIPVLIVGFTIVVTQVTRSDVAQSGTKGNVPASSPDAALPLGKWNVEFANQVIEQCDIFKFDGELHTTVEEPERRSRGRMTITEESFVINYNDDRVERWTRVGKHFVVEHWFPGSRFPTAAPVLGIAELMD